MTDTTLPINPTTQAELRSFVERVETLNEEIDERQDLKRDVYVEARGRGYDVRALKEVVRLRRLDPAESRELNIVVRTYLAALDTNTTTVNRSNAVTTAPTETDDPLERVLGPA